MFYRDRIPFYSIAIEQLCQGEKGKFLSGSNEIYGLD